MSRPGFHIGSRRLDAWDGGWHIWDRPEVVFERRIALAGFDGVRVPAAQAADHLFAPLLT